MLIIEGLQEIELATGVSFSRKIERSFWGLEDLHQEICADKFTEVEECLFKIKPSHVNTMEIFLRQRILKNWPLKRSSVIRICLCRTMNMMLKK